MLREPIVRSLVHRGMRSLSIVVVVVAACSDGKKFNDAAPDVTFTGEFVDWDSTDANFCGVMGYTLTVHGDPSRTKTVTAPNGRFILPIAGGVATTRVDVTPPTAGSQCISGNPTYTLPGTIVADSSVIAAQGLYSARMITTTRASAFYAAVGGLDTTKAQLFVHVDGTPRAVAISGTSGAAQAFDGNAWAAGATGVDVLFPNVDASTGSTMVTMTGTATGTGSVPLVAGQFTWVSVIAQ